MNRPSIPVQGTAASQSQFHASHTGESACAADFDRWTISLGAIDSFLRGKGREAVENIAERMCRRAEHQQGTKSFNLSSLKKDFSACGLPVDSSHGRSKEQKVKIVTGLILRLQTEANSGVAERPLGNSFCALMKKSESSIAEGMQQLLDEVNGHFAGEPLATSAATQGGGGKDDDSPGFSGLPDDQHDLAYQYSKQPVSFLAPANPAVTPVAPPPCYDGYSSETGTTLAHLGAHIERLLGDPWGDDQIIECRNQMQWINAQLANLEAGGLEHYAGKFTEVRKQFQELKVKDLHHRLDKLEEVNIENSRDVQSMKREIARLSKCFSELGLVGDEERSRLVERQQELDNQLDEAKRSRGIINNLESLITDLNDLKYRKLADADELTEFFTHIVSKLSEMSAIIDDQPAGSQGTELLEKESQVRDLLNNSKKAIKRQRLNEIKRLIETQENNHDKGAALHGDTLEQVDKQIHDFKAQVDKVKMDEEESALLKDLGGRQAKLKLINHGVDQFSDLKKKLEPYENNVSDSQQATATSRKVKDRFDPLKKEFNDYLTEYCSKSADLEDQVSKCERSGHPREQLLGKMLDLKIFYEYSLKKAGDLRLEKFVGKPAYDNENQILRRNIDHIRTALRALEEQVSKLKHEDQELRGVVSRCKQS